MIAWAETHQGNHNLSQAVVGGFARVQSEHSRKHRLSEVQSMQTFRSMETL